VVATHPIQYQAPLYRHLATSDVIHLRVVFVTDFGMAQSFDPGFGQSLAFDVPLTDGYEHTFLTKGCTQQRGRWSPPPPGLVSHLSPEDCDVVLVHGYSSVPSWATCTAATARGIPYMLRGDTSWESDAARPATRRWAKRQLIGPLMRRAGACVAIGSSNRRFYQSYGVAEDRIVMAPFSVDTDRFARQGAEGRARRTAMLRAQGLDPALLTLCFAAKLQPHKRPFDVLAALGRMTTPANLIIIGDGPLRRAVTEAAARFPTARVLGFVNQSAIGRWFGASDVIVLPSEVEPWGLVVNEAMAAGAVPVVSSAVGCAADLVRGCGIVYPVGEVAALADGFDRLAADPQALATAQITSRVISDKHSLAASARGYEEAAAIAHESAGLHLSHQRAPGSPPVHRT
jgi:glycosyltransferase involved in cell wall biosynthesis